MSVIVHEAAIGALGRLAVRRCWFYFAVAGSFGHVGELAGGGVECFAVEISYFITAKERS